MDARAAAVRERQRLAYAESQRLISIGLQNDERRRQILNEIHDGRRSPVPRSSTHGRLTRILPLYETERLLALAPRQVTRDTHHARLARERPESIPISLCELTVS